MNLLTVLNSRYRDKFTIALVLLGLFFGAVGMFDPLDVALKASRVKMLPSVPSGKYVFIGVNGHDLEKYGSWPWKRSFQAEILKKSMAAGASRTFIDFDYSGKADPAENRALGEAIKLYGSRVVVFSRPVLRDGIEQMTRPESAVIGGARFFDGKMEFGAHGAVARMPYERRLAGESVRSYAAELADVNGRGDFPVNYGIDASRVPTLSVDELMNGNPNIAGKTVVIGANDRLIGDIKFIPFQGDSAPGAMFGILGAETLELGTPTDFGWLPFFVIGLVAAMFAGMKKSRTLLAVAQICVPAAFMICALVANYGNVFFDVFPGIFIFSTVLLRSRFTKAAKSASIDAQTGLPNSVALCARKNEADQTLVVLALRNYAALTQTLSATEQKVLFVAIAQRIATVGEEKVFRIESDCLAWFSHIDDVDQLHDHLMGLVAILTFPVKLDDRKVGIEVGISVDRQFPAELRHRLAASSEDARNSSALFGFRNPVSEAEIERRVSLGHELREGLNNGQLWVALQPQELLSKGTIVGAECLVRWLHPIRGVIDPDIFIPVAEKSELIADITLFVLSEACRMSEILASGGNDIQLAVNLSPSLFAEANIADKLIDVMRSSGTPSSRIKFEITESGNVAKMRYAQGELNKLKLFGCVLSADDFGTGVSTMENLRAAQVKELKVDKSFVRRMNESKSDEAFLRSIINLAHHLQMTVVAEGVENKSALGALKAMGCEVGQGYFIGKPMRFEDFLNFMGIEKKTKRA